MLTVQRKDHLRALLATDRRVVAKEAAAQLGVSEDSIRRDLREMAEAGECLRVYGGAVPVPAEERPVRERAQVSTESKIRVARAAVALIRPASVIALDAGTTTLEMAGMLPHGAELTVITPSPAVALRAAERSEARVVLIGGEVSRHSMVAGGGLALEAIARVGVDTFFLGATGIDPEHGLTCGSLDDAATKRALASRSSQVLVVGSAEKIGAVHRHPVIGMDEVDGIVVDPDDRNPLLARLRTVSATTPGPA